MSALSDILGRETDLVSQFIDVLRQEEAALASAKTDDLDAINTKKLVLVELLNQTGKERSLLIFGEESASRAQTAAWLSENPIEQKARKLWGELIDQASEAKRLHELNGELLSLMLRKTSDALAVLTRRQQDQALYGSNGHASPATGSRIVDSA